ncbi:MAG: hypothetical protein JO108_11505 [Acidobacteriaceae bacterium]|nr:hypothetical protein [Acidobacteriaceae bacterium]
MNFDAQSRGNRIRRPFDEHSNERAKMAGGIRLSDLDEEEMDLVVELLESTLREHIER